MFTGLFILKRTRDSTDERVIVHHSYIGTIEVILSHQTLCPTVSFFTQLPSSLKVFEFIRYFTQGAEQIGRFFDPQLFTYHMLRLKRCRSIESAFSNARQSTLPGRVSSSLGNIRSHRSISSSVNIDPVHYSSGQVSHRYAPRHSEQPIEMKQRRCTLIDSVTWSFHIG